MLNLDKLRIDDQQKNALEFALRNLTGPVFLFGSRINLKEKGGDLDLLIYSNEDKWKLTLQVSVDYKQICEEKIDVMVVNPDELTLEEQVFIEEIEKIQIK